VQLQVSANLHLYLSLIRTEDAEPEATGISTHLHDLTVNFS